MDKDLHDIEDLFKSALDDNEEMPPAKVWDAVDNRLDKDTVVAIKKKYKTWKRLSLLLLLLLISLSLYELNNRRTNNGITKTNNGVVGKESVLNNDNDNKKQPDKNSFTSKEQTDSKDVNNNTTANTIPDNPAITVQPSGNNLIINKQNQPNLSTDVNTIANSPVAVKQNSLLTLVPGYRNNIKTANPGSNMQNATTGNNSVQTNKQMPLSWQWNHLPAEKINTQITALPEPKNSLLSTVSTKNNPLIDTKNTVAQLPKKKETKPSRFSITGFFSPDNISYRLEDDDVINQPDNSAEIKKTEHHEFSSTTGALVDYELNKHWTLQSGLTFANTNIVVDPKTIYAQTVNNGGVKYRLNISSGYGYLVPSFQPSPLAGDSLKVTGTTHKLRYLGIPIAVKYTISKGKLKIEAMAGVSTNFLTMGKVETEIQQGPNNEIDILNKIEGLKSIYLSGMAGIGAEYKLTKKLSFTLMPTARFALNPINKGAVVKTFPNSFGLAAGLKLRF